MDTAEESALTKAYQLLLERWWILLGSCVLGTVVGLAFGMHAEAFTAMLALVVIVYAFLGYQAQILVIWEMSNHGGHPRMGVEERKFWHTLMVLGVFLIFFGMIAEMGAFLFYAKRFIAHRAKNFHGHALPT